MCIKNEIELIEFLITKCKADINAKATQGETPLFVCIKYALNLFDLVVTSSEQKIFKLSTVAKKTLYL